MVQNIAGGRRFGWALSLSLLACGSGTDPLDSVGATVTMSGPVGGPSGDEPPDGTVTGSGPTSTTSDDPTTTTDGAEPTREICDRYLDCLAATSPQQLPQAQEGYGPMGTCWQGTPETIQQCIEACATGLGLQHQLFPDDPKCNECVDTADCPPGELCSAGECASPMPVCGDGIVGDGEVCDFPGDDCSPECDGPGCNPFNNAGCEVGEECHFRYVEGTVSIYCSTAARLPLGAPCSSDPEHSCGAGHMCSGVPFAVDCPETLCCVALCNFQTGSTCPQGQVCSDILDGTSFANFVGVCVPE